jgi:hypothetical protein
MHTKLWLKKFGEKDHLVDVGQDGNMFVISKKF